MRHAKSLVLVLSAMLIQGCGDDDAMDTADASVDGGDSLCGAPFDCDDDIFCNGVEECDPDDTAADARGCVASATAACMSTQTCDEPAQQCVSDCTVAGDADSDGTVAIACGGNDCADADPNRYPGNTEICDIDGHDEDCDPATFGFRDQDMDGSPDVLCCNEGRCGTDCDDLNPGANPTAPEVCDGRDNDCDGTVDEGVLTLWIEDHDADGFGGAAVDAVTMLACLPPMGFVADATDCDDDDPEVNPANAEVCDASERDENCSGMVNEDCDCEAPDSRSCAESGASGRCATGIQICDPLLGVWRACSIEPSAEICNLEDDDCDGTIDDGVTVDCWADADDDGFAASGAEMTSQCPSRPIRDGCASMTTNVPPIGADLDCNDDDRNINPTRVEVCNGFDDDCDGVVDETLTIVCYVDGDGDTYAATGAPPSNQCPQAGRPEVGGCPASFTNRAPAAGADCNDTPPEGNFINPAQPELCDPAMVDENCDGMGNEGCDCTLGSPDIPCGLPGVCMAGTRSCVVPPGAYGMCSISPTAESCDGLDNNCDGTVDDGFECTGSSTVTCVHPTCGTTGSRTCDSASCTLDTCTAAEDCNGCDDDNDTQIDETFTCFPGETNVPCTTSCGTNGVGECDSVCLPTLDCAAATETCNYCDDTGDGTFHDEHLLGVLVNNSSNPKCGGFGSPPNFGIAIDHGCTPASTPFSCHEQLFLTTPVLSAEHSYNIAVITNQLVGYGVVAATVAMRSTSAGATPPDGGWAVVLTASSPGLAIADYSYPHDEVGLAIEWDWNGDLNDIIRVRRLTGSASGSEIGSAFAPSSMRLSSGRSTRLEQVLHVRYQPFVVGGAEEKLEIATSRTGAPIIELYNLLGPGGTTQQRQLQGEFDPTEVVHFSIGADADNWSTAMTTSWLGVSSPLGCLFAGEEPPTELNATELCP